MSVDSSVVARCVRGRRDAATRDARGGGARADGVGGAGDGNGARGVERARVDEWERARAVDDDDGERKGAGAGVGVGDADFSKMDVLDADTNPLYSTKYCKHMSRDIVQFVPFREFQSDPMKLAKEVLTEIPGQLVNFFQTRNIQPRPAKEEQRQKIAAQLSLKSKVDPNKQLDMYQSVLKEKLISEAQNIGLDTFQVQDVIEEKGLFENDM